jgi:hypothetical protein
MNRDFVIDYLRNLTAKQFAELFYDAMKGQDPWGDDLTDVRYVLAYACRDKIEPDDEWDFSIDCPVPNEKWIDDAPICQHGRHCGLVTISWAKQSICPICGGDVYGT